MPARVRCPSEAIQPNGCYPNTRRDSHRQCDFEANGEPTACTEYGREHRNQMSRGLKPR